jgi:hypothetical protein
MLLAIPSSWRLEALSLWRHQSAWDRGCAVLYQGKDGDRALASGCGDGGFCYSDDEMTEFALVIMLQMLFGACQFAAMKANSSRLGFALILLILVLNFCLIVVILFGTLIRDAIQAFQIDPEFFHEEYDSFDFFLCSVTSFFISGLTTFFAVLFSTKSYREPDDEMRG